METDPALGQIVHHAWVAGRIILILGLGPALVIGSIGIAARLLERRPLRHGGWHGSARGGLIAAGIVNLMLLAVSLAVLLAVAYGVVTPEQLETGDRVLPLSSTLTLLAVGWGWHLLGNADHENTPPE